LNERENVALKGQGFELIGISLFGPKPVDAVHLDLSEGLSVLYGLNGSGKSTILKEAEAVLRGIGPHSASGVASNRSCLHVRLTSLQESPDEFENSSFEAALFESLLPADPAMESIPSHNTRLERWKWLINEFLSQELDEEWIWDIEPLASQQDITFSLVPIGTFDRPSWGSYLSVHLAEAEHENLRDWHDLQRKFLSEIIETGKSQYEDAVLDSLGQSPIASFDTTPWNRIAAGRHVMERDYLARWPANFPIPVSTFGRIEASPVHVISDSGSVESTRDATNNLLIAHVESQGDLIDIADDAETRFHPAFSARVSRLEDDANSFLDFTGPHFFRLVLELKSPGEWFVGEVPEWIAEIEGGTISLGRLSGAEQRWALTALQWAISGLDPSRPQMFLMDEPERGLHRLRERELPRMLNSLCSRSEQMMVLTASHSPSFLDVRVGADLHHVSRLRGLATSLRAVDLGTSVFTSQPAEVLGLSSAELLQLTTVFVLVEGVHDERVLTVAIGDEVGRVGGRIIPINGAANARSIADARILLDATDASIVLVLDNVISGPALEIWNAATELLQNGERKSAKATLGRLPRLGPGGELLWLQELGERAIDANVIHRIKPFGLSKRDIVCYLPVSEFIPGAAKWEDLEAAYDSARAKRLTNADFKSWLKTMRGAVLSRERIDIAAKSLGDKLPREFDDLSLTVQSLGLMGAIDPLERQAGQ
jgi:energy-coupling factor transporter ATP-binding protein EcfA2